MDILYCTLGKYDEAREMLRSALDISSRMPYPVGRGDALLSLGRLHSNLEELADAMTYFSQALNVFEQAKDPRRIDVTHACLSSTYARRICISSMGPNAEIMEELKD